MDDISFSQEAVPALILNKTEIDGINNTEMFTQGQSEEQEFV